MTDDVAAEQGTEELATDADRYSDAREVLSLMIDQVEAFDGPVDRIQVGLFANGEAVWRVWPARADEPEVGHQPAAEPG